METSLRWVRGEKSFVAVAYRTSPSVKIYPIISEYSYFLSATKKKSETTVKLETQAAFTFVQFLDKKRRLISSVDDDLLQVFCDESINNVRRNKASRGDERAIKRTVNAKLRIAYWFIWWYQNYHCPSTSLIGPVGCRVTSSLNFRLLKARRGRSLDDGFRTRFISHDERFPKCFRDVGTPSIHRTQRVPSADEIQIVRDSLSKNGINFTSARNLLFQKIAETTGLRRSAINSLRITQLNEQAIERAKGDIVRVTPDDQKFSYQVVSEFPIDLAYQVLYFVESYYKPLYDARNWPIERGGDRIFTSERTGRPLAAATFTRIFSAEFKELNAGKGAAVHILRHYYTINEIVKEIRMRLTLGMDTSLMSICRTVSLKLGQSSPESIRPYVSQVISKMFRELADASTKKV